MVGQCVSHSNYGKGTIVKVTQRENFIPVIEIRFAADDIEPKSCNSNSFKTGRFIELDIPPPLIGLFHEWRAQWEEEQALIREREAAFERGKKAFEALAAYYNVSLGKVVTRQGPTVLAELLVKIDEGEQLSADQLRHLESADCANVAATYLYRQYRRTSDPWQLVKACSYLRKAGQPANVLKISAMVVNSISDPTAHSALLTTMGGAHRDTNDLAQAKKCADQAIILSPQSYHPHNLMGAILYSEGDYPRGDEHFRAAELLGSSTKVQDSEIRTILENTTPENKRAIVDYLITKNPERYGWVISDN